MLVSLFIHELKFVAIELWLIPQFPPAADKFVATFYHETKPVWLHFVSLKTGCFLHQTNFRSVATHLTILLHDLDIVFEAEILGTFESDANDVLKIQRLVKIAVCAELERLFHFIFIAKA